MTDQLRALEEELVDNPDNREAFAELSRQLWDDGDWQSVLELYLELASHSAEFVDFSELTEQLQSHADSLESGTEKSQILLALGDLYIEYLEAREEGMQAYQTAFKAYPEDVTPLRRARRIYRASEDWSVLLDVYNIELRVIEEPEERVELLLDMAQIEGDKMRDFEAAVQTLEQIYELGGDDPFVDQLAEFYTEEMAVEDGIRAALGRAEEVLNEGPLKAAADEFIEAAQLEFDRYGGSVDEALALAKAALDAAPDHEDAQLVVDALSAEVMTSEEDADDVPVNGEVAAAVPSTAADAEAEGEQKDASASDEDQTDAPEPDEDQTDAPEPDEEQTDAPEPDEEQTDAPDSDEDEEDERTVEAFFRGIEDFDGDLEEAQQLLESERTNLSALKKVRRELLDSGDVEALAEVLEDSVRYFRKKEGEWEIMTELANLFWLELGDDDQAEYYFKRLKLLDDEHPDVFKFYEAYYEQEGNWRKLFTLLSGRLDHIDDREDYRLVADRLSEIAELELGSPEKAIDVWKSFSRQFPDDDEARRRLRHLYEDHDKWNALVDLLKEEVRRLADHGEDTVDRRINLLEEMAHIYRSHLNLDTMVMNVLGQILDLDPAHASAFGQLRDLYESNRRFNDLANLLAQAAEQAVEREELGMAIGHLREVAEIWEERLNNQTQAIPHLERIVEIAPDEQDVRTRLREIYEKRRDFSSLFDLRLKETQLLGEEESIEELDDLLELSRDRLRDPDREAAVLDRLLEYRPDDLELVEALEGAHEQREDWASVAETLERKSQLLTDDDAIGALARAARLYRLQLDDNDEATRLWESIRDASPGHEEAFEALSEILSEEADYDGLETLYRQEGAVEQLFELLGELAEQRPDDAVGLHRRRIGIADDELDEPTAVIEALEQLSSVSDDPNAVRRELLPWYRQIEDADSEIETRQTLLEAENDAESAYDQILTIAELEEGRQQSDAALAWSLEAFELQPQRDTALDRAEELAGELGMWSALRDKALGVAEGLDDEAVREQIWARCARIEWHHLQEYQQAIDRYERLRERHPDEFEFLEALDALYELSEQPRKRMDVLQEQIDLLRERGAADVDLVDQLSKVADVQRTHLDEAEQARETYSEILDLQPDHLGAVRGKKELHRDDERWMEVVDHLLREVPLAANESLEAQWAAKLELADVYRRHLDDLHEALRYYGEILGENPEYDQALEAVRKLLAEDGLARDAAMLLEPIFRDQQQYAPLVEALEARLRVTDDQFEKQEILDELIPLYAEELEKFDEAFEYARRQFEIDPERDDIWLRVEQLGAKLDRWELIEEMFTRESPLQGHESSTRYDLLRHLAAIREHQLGQVEGALEAWERLHEYDPLDAPALEALERLYRKTDDSAQLVDALRQRAELVEIDEDRIELLTEAGQLLAGELDDPVEATDIFRRVLSIDPEHDTAVSMLDELLRKQERWHDLEALLLDQADQTLQPERRRTFLYQLAELRFEELDDIQGAVDIVCQLLEDDPGDDRILEFARQLDQTLADDEGTLELRLDLTRTLEPIYRMRDEYDRLDEMLEVRLAGGVGEFEQVEILDELVELRQKRLTDPEGALDALRRAVVLQPDDEQRRKKLLELASGLDRLSDAMETLAEAASGADPFVAVTIWKRLGEIAIQKLNEPADSIEYYEQARKLDDTDREVLDVLGQLFEATNQSERLCDNLAEQARFADPDERIELLRRIGTLREHVLEDPVDAIEAYRQILDVQPDDLGAIDALERLYIGQEQYFDLVELLERKIPLVDGESERIAVLEQWAEVAEEQLQDIAQAIDIYRRILDEAPEHRSALAALDRLLEAEHQWAEWSQIVRRRLEGPDGDDADTRLELRLRLGRVLVDELLEIDEALELYRGILEEQSDQEDAVRALESIAEDDSMLEEVAPDLVEIYRDQKRWQDLAKLYERRRDHAMDPEFASELEFRRAKLLRDRLDEPQPAMRAFARAWRDQIDDDQYRQALVQLGTEVEAWDLLVELLEEGLEVVVDPEMSRQLHMMLARLWQDVLEDTMEAQAHLREVLSAEPRHDEAFATLSELLHAEERWFDLVELLEQRHDAIITDDEQGAIELLMTVAGIQEIHLDDGFSAVETLRRVRTIDPRDDQAVEELERLLTEQERWEDLAQFYEEVATTSPLPSERLEAELALADLCRGPLERQERAIELYGRALDIDAEHERAIEALESIFEESPDVQVDVAPYLETVYRTRQEYGGLVRVLQARADGTDDVDQRGVWLRELLDLFEEFVDDPKHAWAVAADLFSDDPGDRRAREMLWELTSRAHAWEKLAEVYATTLENNLAVEDQLRARLHLDVAELYADRLDDLLRGREAAQAAVELCPDSDDAIDTVERLLQREGAWHDLADFYRGQAQFSAEEDRVRYWYEKLAALYEDVLEDIDATVDVYAQLLEIAPGDETYRSAMERVLTTVERWYELADIYRQRIAGALDEEVITRNRLALAELLESELDSLEEAVDLYQRVLDDDPDHSDAIRALEGVRRDLETRDGDWKMLQQKVIEALLKAYDERRSWRRVGDLLDEQIDLLDDPHEQVEILIEKAQLLLRSTQDDIERVHALTNLARAFCLDPTNDEIDELIEALAEDLEAWQRIIPIYLRALEQTDDVDRQGHILAAVAQIYEHRIGDTESAIAAYQQSVEISAESEIALEKLQELYGEMEKWQPLVGILERRLEELHDPDRKQQLRKRIARIYDEKLDHYEQSLRLYREIRREEPTEIAHLVVMERLFEEVEDFEGLEELLLDKLQLVDAEELRVRAFKRLGEIRRDHLGRTDDAIASYHDALDIDADDAEAAQALVELYRSAERWPDLLDVLRNRRDQAEEVEAINEIEVEMGDILLERMDDPRGAFRHYETALQRDRDNYLARGALFRLLNDEQLRRDAATVLTEVHRGAEEWDELEALYQRLIELSDEPADIGEHYLDLARMQEQDLGIPFKAFATLSTAVREVAELDSVRAELERLAEELDSTDDLVAIYEEALEAGVDDPEVRRSLHLVVGGGYAEQEQLDSAIAHFEAVLDIDEYDLDALSWLDEIYQAQRDWENLVPILEAKRAVASGEEQRQATFQLAYLLEVAYEESMEAFELYREVLLEESDHGGAIEGLERLCEEPGLRAEILELLEPVYREQEHWAKLARLFSLKLQVVEAAADRAALLCQMADVQYQQLDDVEEAFGHWCRALKEDPFDGEVQVKLEDLADAHQWYPALIDVFEDIADELDDPGRKLELAERAAGWAMEELDDSRRAADLYRYVVEVEPEHEEGLEILETVARQDGDEESLAAVLGARVQSTFDDEELIELYTELASVRLSLQHYDRAIEAFRELIELDGENLERLETLAQLFEMTERWPEYVDTKQRLLEYQEDEMLRAEMMTEMGRICLEEVEDFARARQLFEDVLDIRSDDAQVMRHLEDVYTELEDWQPLETLLSRQLDMVEDEDEAVRLYIRRAELLLASSNDVEAAIDDYQAAFELREGHPDVLDALDELYRQQQRWSDLIGLLNARVNQADDEDRAVELMLEMAAVAHEKLEATERAAEFARAVLEWQPGTEAALDRLEAIYRSSEDWQEVVGVIDRRIEMVESPEERTALMKERARTLDEDAGALAAAAETYQVLLDSSPDDEELMERLETIYDETDDGEGMYRLLAHRAERADDEEQCVELYLQMADVAAKYLGGGEQRIQPLEAAREIGGDDLDIVEPLLDAYIEGGSFDQAEPLLASVIETLTENRQMKEVVRFHHLRGKLAEQQGDIDAAKEAYEEAHRLDATYIPNLLSLGTMLFENQDYEGAKKIFQVLLLHQMNIDDDEDKVEVYFHLGAIREQNGDERGARDMYKRALRVIPSHPDSKAALEALEA